MRGNRSGSGLTKVQKTFHGEKRVRKKFWKQKGSYKRRLMQPKLREIEFHGILFVGELFLIRLIVNHKKGI